MEHQDIADLILSGDIDVAKALIAQREGKSGISGHDRQKLQTLLDNAQPEVAAAKVEAGGPAQEAEDRPSVSRSSGRGRNPLGGTQ